MQGTIYVEWDETAEPPKCRYYGYGEIDGKRVRITGDIDRSQDRRRVRLVIRDGKQRDQR